MPAVATDASAVFGALPGADPSSEVLLALEPTPEVNPDSSAPAPEPGPESSAPGEEPAPESAPNTGGDRSSRLRSNPTRRYLIRAPSLIQTPSLILAQIPTQTPNRTRTQTPIQTRSILRLLRSDYRSRTSNPSPIPKSV